MLKIRTNVLFGAEQEPPCVRRKSATAEAAERQYRATAEVAQRRRRYAPAAAALGWAGRDAAAALKMHQPQKITLYRHLSAEMLQMFLLVSRGETRYLCAPASGGKSRFCGAGGAQYRARGAAGEERRERAAAARPSQRRQAASGVGARARAVVVSIPRQRGRAAAAAARGTSPARPAKVKSFPQLFAAPLFNSYPQVVPFFAAVPYFFRQ